VRSWTGFPVPLERIVIKAKLLEITHPGTYFISTL